MATDVFHGKIDGFPEISVDYFLGSRLHCSKFFLSHCHTDHIKGLDSLEFKSIIHNHNVKIYCTRVTGSLVLRRSKLDYLASSFVYLEKGESYTINVSHDETINVTVFEANHCPGSVMFLFSRNGARALYTGDFRFAKDSTIDNTIKNVNSLYIDTTFFSPEIAAFREFPSRLESEDAVLRFILREKELNQLIDVHIDVTPGWENIFIALANHYDCDIQASENLYNQYTDVEEIVFYLTLKNSWIHINQTNTECTLCSETTLKLRPSIQWKLHNNMLNNDVMIAAKAGAQNTWYVTHSMHSSYNECCYFIDQVSADKVFPIAIPPRSSNHKISSLLKKFWKENPSASCIPVAPFSSPPKSPMFPELSNDNNNFLQIETFEGVLSSESDDCSNPISFNSIETKKMGMIESIHKDMADLMENPSCKLSGIGLKVKQRTINDNRDSDTDGGNGRSKRHRQSKKIEILLSSSSESDEETYFSTKKSHPKANSNDSTKVFLYEKDFAEISKTCLSSDPHDSNSTRSEFDSRKTGIDKHLLFSSDNEAYHCSQYDSFPVLEKKHSELAHADQNIAISSEDAGIMDCVMTTE